jgi:hypothetical protein
LRRCRCGDFSAAQAAVVVEVARQQRGALAHRFELPGLAPGEGEPARLQRVARRIERDALAVDGGDAVGVMASMSHVPCQRGGFADLP